jgi:eukaryotic-like serine/threonine-protein kinase
MRSCRSSVAAGWAWSTWPATRDWAASSRSKPSPHPWRAAWIFASASGAKPRAAATISHPAVAVVHALEELDEQIFIVSEYVRGHTLRHEIESGPLPPARALAIATEIARGLQAAHEAGVIHRDLKPENVLIADAGGVKVVDFGVAHVDGADGARLTRTGVMLGTPAYMAPEQLLGTDVDARADLYAFGVVLAEMLTGHHPTRHDTIENQALPTHLGPIVARCLQLSPHARYQSARALLEAIDGARACRTS